MSSLECCKVGSGGQDMQLTYFCGSHIQCSNSSNPMALQLAKYNLENRYLSIQLFNYTCTNKHTSLLSRYSVVGVMEHFNISIAVMESYLPRFFKGASHKMSSLLTEGKNNSNPHPKPDKQTRFRNDLIIRIFSSSQRLLL